MIQGFLKSMVDNFTPHLLAPGNNTKTFAFDHNVRLSYWSGAIASPRIRADLKRSYRPSASKMTNARVQNMYAWNASLFILQFIYLTFDNLFIRVIRIDGKHLTEVRKSILSQLFIFTLAL